MIKSNTRGKKKLTPAAGYVRMSTDDQEDSPEQQRAEIKKLASERGYKVVKWYSDLGISGDRTDRRVEFQQMIADGVAGDFQSILCWDQDRFGRFDSLEAGHWIHPLRQSGITLVTTTQGEIDWNDFAGRIVYSVVQEGKHEYLRSLSKNVTRALEQIAADGKWPAGPPPFGYVVGPDRKLQLGLPSDVALVRRMFHEFVHENRSLRAIADRLGADGYLSPRGTPWTFTAVRAILQNPCYLGHLAWNRNAAGKYRRKPGNKTGRRDPQEWTVRENVHPPIIDAETFHRAATVTKNRKRTHSTPRKDGKFALSGLLFCGHCGHRMTGTSAGNGTPVYVCYNYLQRGKSACNGNRVQQRVVLANVVAALQDHFNAKTRQRLREAILKKLDRMDAESETRADQVHAVEAEIAKMTRRLTLVQEKNIPIIESRLVELESELSELRALQSARPKNRKRFAKEQIDEMLRVADDLAGAVAGSDPDLIRQLVVRTIQRVDVTMDREQMKPSAPGKKPKHVYRVREGTVWIQTEKVFKAGTINEHLLGNKIRWFGDVSAAAA